MPNSILNTTVTMYASITDTTGKPANLLTLLTTNKFKERIEHLRTIYDPKQSGILKKSLPLFSISAALKSRAKDNIIVQERTRLMQIDFDKLTPNQMQWLKEALPQLPFIAYIGVSCRGAGLVALVHIAKPNLLLNYFTYVEEKLKNIGIIPDTTKGRNVHDLRFVSYDPNPYINHNASPLELPSVKGYGLSGKTDKPSANALNAPRITQYSDTLIRCIELLKNAHKGDLHNTTIKVAYTLGGYATATKSNGENILKLILHTIKDCNQFTDKEHHYKYAKQCFQNGLLVPLKIDELQANAVELLKANEAVQVVEHTAVKESVNLKPPALTTYARKSTGYKSNNDDLLYKNLSGWDCDINELEQYFHTANLPAYPIQLNAHCMVTKTSLFIESHFATVKANNGKRTFLPFLNRLQELKQYLENNTIYNG